MSIDRLDTLQLEVVDGQFLYEDGSIFDVEAYSRMKYGDAEQAWRYGMSVAEFAIAQTSDQLLEQKAVVSVPACVYSPKPAFAVARAMLSGVNAWRAEHDVQPAKMLRMYSEAMGRPDYAQSSLSERQKDRFTQPKQRHIPPSLVEGAVVYAVDDCVITGSTEKSQFGNIAPFSPSAFISAPAVIIDPENAKQFPGIEHVMNMAADPDLEMVQSLIDEGKFLLNSRVLKLILSHENVTELAEFLRGCSWELLSEIYEACINSTLEFVEEYSLQVAMVSKILRHSQEAKYE